jgi:hypothetical protein
MPMLAETNSGRQCDFACDAMKYSIANDDFMLA